MFEPPNASSDGGVSDAQPSPSDLPPSTCVLASDWQPAFEYHGLASVGTALAEDATGTLYALSATDLRGTSFEVRRSRNAGKSWELVGGGQRGIGMVASANDVLVAGELTDRVGGVFRHPGAAPFDEIAVAGAEIVARLYQDGDGALYATGGGLQNGQTLALVYRSRDHGTTWTEIDRSQFVGSSNARGVTEREPGTLLVMSATGGLREGLTTGGPFHGAGQLDLLDARELARDSRGTVFALGSSVQNGGRWRVFRKPTGGSWTMVAPRPGMGIALGFAEDSSGALYLAGSVDSQWIILRSSDGGVSWEPSMTYSYMNQATRGGGMLRDANGNLWAIGSAGDRLLVRMLPCE